MFFFFFFSSRRRHTRCSRDWSSDVCSSDLAGGALGRHRRSSAGRVGRGSGLGGHGGGTEQAGGGARRAAGGARAGIEAAAGGRLGFGGFCFFLAPLAARDAAGGADQTDEGAAVRAGITLRCPLFIPAGPAPHAVVFFELGFVHALICVETSERERVTTEG